MALSNPLLDKLLLEPSLLYPGVKPTGRVEAAHPDSQFCYSPLPSDKYNELFKLHPQTAVFNDIQPDKHNSFLGASPYFHPTQGIDNIAYGAETLGGDDTDITCILIGYIGSVSTANGWAVTRTPTNAAWTFQMGAGVGGVGKISAFFVQGSPLAGHGATLSGTYATGDFVRLVGRKKGGVISIFEGGSHEKVEVDSGQNGVMRTGSIGWAIGKKSGESCAGWYSLASVINAALTDDEIWEILRDPMPNLVHPISQVALPIPVAAGGFNPFWVTNATRIQPMQGFS